MLYSCYILALYSVRKCSHAHEFSQPGPFAACALQRMMRRSVASQTTPTKENRSSRSSRQSITILKRRITLQTDATRMHLISFASTSLMKCHHSSPPAGPAQAKRARQFTHVRTHTGNCANARRFKNPRPHCIRVSCENEWLHSACGGRPTVDVSRFPTTTHCRAQCVKALLDPMCLAFNTPCLASLQYQLF